jgi:ribosome assembly protein 1
LRSRGKYRGIDRIKTATINNNWLSIPLKAMTFQSKPMLKVAVEPLSHKDLKSIENGLHLLYQYDPAVEIGMEDNGQHTMTCLGELHLDQCVKALTERFAKCEVKVSEPLVSFKETILPSLEGFTAPTETISTNTNSSFASELPPPWSDIPGIHKPKDGSIRIALDSGNIAITVKCFPLPINAANFIEKEVSFMNNLDDYLTAAYSQFHSKSSSLSSSSSSSSEGFNYVYDYLAKKKEFQMIWEQFLKTFSLKEEEESVPSTAEDQQTKINEYYYYDDHGEGTYSPQERKRLYLQSLFTAFQATMNEGGEKEKEKEGINDSATDLLFQNNLLSIGPKAAPSNLLFFSRNCSFQITDELLTNSSAAVSPHPSQKMLGEITRSNHPQVFHKIWNRLHNSIIVGFQEAINSGLIMHEPIFGIGYVIQKIEFHYLLVKEILSGNEEELKQCLFLSPVSSESQERLQILPTGQLISEVKDSLRLILLSCPIRILEPIYQCNLQCDQQQLGNLYAVLSRRRGHVYCEDIIEGTSMYLLFAYLPVEQSFHFTSELLKKTSGSGTAPQLTFSHWKLILQDPFWKPRTEEEKEEYGDLAFNEHNLAKLFINSIRKRKGLPIDEQIVQFAEKQRTLNKKK